MRSMFNPFNKSFKEITERDLSILKSVSEGWYIEYKMIKPKGKAIAKSISSFANSYGGVYFIGIEHDTSTNCCKNIEGVDDSPDVIRDSVRGHIQPFPYFESFSIPLENGNKVIMAVIPEGENPPYMHSDGRIYRRQEAASDPNYEKDRHIMDLLYKKATDFENKLEDFRKNDYTFNGYENKMPHLQIFINMEQFNHFIIGNLFSKDKLSSILEKFNGPLAISDGIDGNEVSFNVNVGFDTLNTYHNSVAIRNLEGKDLTYNGLSVELDIHGNAKFLIPLSQIQLDIEDLNEKYAQIILKSDEESFYSIDFLDAKFIFSAILGLVNKYSEIISEFGINGKIQVKLRLSNCHRTSLYFNSNTFIKHIETFGFPICMKNNEYFPLSPFEANINDLISHPIFGVIPLFVHCARALGVPDDIAVQSILEELTKDSNPS